MKLRNINRGLVLGAVLTVGVVCYAVYDHNTFKANKPEIEETVESYVKAIAESNVGKAEALNSQWTELVNDKFTDYAGNDDYGVTKTDILSEINGTTVKSSQAGEITSAESNIKNISISKSGADGAKVNFSYSICYEVTYGDPYFMSFSGLSSFNSGDYSANDVYEPSRSPYKAFFDGYAEFYLIRTGDGWKIASVEDYGYGENYTYENDGDDENSEGSADSEPIADSTADESEKEAEQLD